MAVELCPDPLGELTAIPDARARLKELYPLREWKEGEGRRIKWRGGKWEKGKK